MNDRFVQLHTETITCIYISGQRIWRRTGQLSFCLILDFSQYSCRSVVFMTTAKMLEYENQMFLDILHEDGLLVAARFVTSVFTFQQWYTI